MDQEQAVAEIIGAVLLIGIIVGAFGIFAAIYLPSLIPDPIPQVRISMACNNTTGANDVEFPCIRGSFNCHPFDNRTCEKDCEWRDYSKNPDLSSEDHSRERGRCMENCMSPICSDLRNCGVLYVCHNGGDSIKISDLRIVVNGNPTPKNSWGIKQQLVSDDFIPVSVGAVFHNGDSLRIVNPAGGQPVDKVMVLYSFPSGSEVTLVMNQFGTNVD